MFLVHELPDLGGANMTTRYFNILLYPCMLSVCCSFRNKHFCQIFPNNYSSEVLEISTHSLFRHVIWSIFLPIGRHPSVKWLLFFICILNFQSNYRHIFLSNYSSQIIRILRHSLFRHAINWFFCTNQALTSF